MKKHNVFIQTLTSLLIAVAPVTGGYAQTYNYIAPSGSPNTGYSNIFLGVNAGHSNTTGYANVLIGHRAGESNTTGYANIFVGRESGRSNKGGRDNVFLGDWTGIYNTAGYNNVFVGLTAGYNNTTGYNNVFMGRGAGIWNTVGHDNLFLGLNAGASNTTASYNMFIGTDAGGSNVNGENNVFIGGVSGFNNTEGSRNVFLGRSSGNKNTTGNDNVLIGYNTGYYNTTGENNIFIGRSSGYSNTTGNSNLFLGYRAGYKNTIGKYNVILGNRAGEDYSFKEDTAVFILNNQTNTFHPLLFGKFAKPSEYNSTTATILRSAQLGINTPKVKDGMTLTVHGRAFIGDANAATAIDTSRLNQFSLWVQKGIVAENFAMAKVSSWADFVFEEDYELAPLEEVASYIRENKRLPAMESEAELKESGYSLHEMNKKMMMKIEELTLYLIAQDQELKRLQSEVKTTEELKQELLAELKGALKQ